MTHPAALPHRIEAQRRRAVAGYPDLWRRLTADWQADSPLDAAWLLYSANYLLRTQGVRWAIDPLTLGWRLPEAPPVPVERDLLPLSFVVLTHCHADHLDRRLLRSLNQSSILWIVPESLRSTLIADAGLRRDRIEVAGPGEPIQIGPLRITILPGLHDERPWRSGDGSAIGRRRTIPGLALAAEFGGRQWLFPGDTRTYAPPPWPRLDPLDGVFAHLWLGAGSAMNPAPPLRPAFCRFVLALGAPRVVLTHLEEFGRGAEDFWEEGQAEGVRHCLHELDDRVQVEIARMGDRVSL